MDKNIKYFDKSETGRDKYNIEMEKFCTINPVNCKLKTRKSNHIQFTKGK